MKKILIIVSIGCFIVLSGMLITGCYTSAKASAKSGAQLWAENCNRCHNAPGPGEFNNDNWDIVGTHMQVRANITTDEIEKITAFLKSANQ